MNNLKKLFIQIFFCGTEEEYSKGKAIFSQERLILRKRWYYWLSALILTSSVLYLMFTYQSLDVFILGFLIIFSSIQLVDATAKHLIVKLLRERKK